MSMTTFGKTLTLLNVVLALVFVAWGIGLYTNQVPWVAPPAVDGVKVQGLVDELKAQVDQLRAARDAADVRWADATLTVQALERERPTNLRVYADRLRSARQGGVPGIDPPVQGLEFPGGTLAVKRTGPPYQIDGQPALSQAGYQKAIQDRLQEITDAEAAVKQLVEETKALTLQIDGTGPAQAGGERVRAEEKGLRRRLYEQAELADKL